MAPAWASELAFARGTASSDGIDVDLGLDADEEPTEPDRPLPVPDLASAPSPGSGQVPLDWALRRMRAQSLLSGLVSGVVVAAAFLAWEAARTRRAPDPAPAVTAAEPAPAAEHVPTSHRQPDPRPVATAHAATRDRAVGAASSAGDGWKQVQDAGDDAPSGGEATDAGALAAPSDAAGEGTGEATDPEATARADPPVGAESQDAPPPGEVAAAAEPDAGEAGPPRTDEAPAAAGHAPDAGEVAAALRVHRAELEACLNTRGAPGRSRTLRLAVVVEPSGRVSNAVVDDQPGASTPLAACVLRITEGMSFAPFEGDPAHVRLALSRPPTSR